MDQPHEKELKILVIQNKLKGMELGSQLRPQSRHICPYIQTKNKKPEGYSYPHSTPQKILMGNHKMEHYRFRINIISLIVSKTTIVETQKQLVGVTNTTITHCLHHHLHQHNHLHHHLHHH